MRGRETRLVPAEELVPGDVVLLESGDRIPADLRLVDVKNLRTEEAALTGKSVPIDKTTDAVPENATVGDREGMAFSGTLVSSGAGWAGRRHRERHRTGAHQPADGCGERTRYAAAAPDQKIRICDYCRDCRGRSDRIRLRPLGSRYGFRRHLSGGRQHRGVGYPEGLPALITVTLAIGVQRMAQRNAIIRRLPAVETLGSVSRICSDKTGTLTLMEMMVVSAVTADAAYKVTGQGYAPEGEVLKEGAPAGEDPVLGLMGRVSMLCNDAEIYQEESAWKVEGDPTEGALYPFGNKLGLERQAEQTAYPRIDAIPFKSEHRFMATLHKGAAGKQFLPVKGAPEVILAHCDRQEVLGQQAAPIDRGYFANSSDRLAARARACWLLHGSKIRVSMPETSVRRTSRKTWFCSA